MFLFIILWRTNIIKSRVRKVMHCVFDANIFKETLNKTIIIPRQRIACDNIGNIAWIGIKLLEITNLKAVVWWHNFHMVWPIFGKLMIFY